MSRATLLTDQLAMYRSGHWPPIGLPCTRFDSREASRMAYWESGLTYASWTFLYWVFNVAQDLEILIARSQAAALRAKQLEEALLASRSRARGLIAARQTQRFAPAARKIFYPQDFEKEQRPRQFRPAVPDEKGWQA